MKNDKVRGIKAVKEFEYNELIKLGKFKDAQKIADANAEWYQSEYQRWTDLAGEAMLGWTLDAYIIPRLGSALITRKELEINNA